MSYTESRFIQQPRKGELVVTSDQVLCVPEQYVGCDIFFLDKSENKKYCGRITGTSPGKEGYIEAELHRLTLSNHPLPQIINMELKLPDKPLIIRNGVRIFSQSNQVIEVRESQLQPIAA